MPFLTLKPISPQLIWTGFLQPTLEHLLRESPEIEFGQLDVARPEAALRHDEGEATRGG